MSKFFHRSLNLPQSSSSLRGTFFNNRFTPDKLSLSLPPTQTHSHTPKPCCSKVKRLIESSGGGRDDGWLSLKKAEPRDSWDNKPQVWPPLLPSTHCVVVVEDVPKRTHARAHTQKDACTLPLRSCFSVSVHLRLISMRPHMALWLFSTPTLFFISDSFERPPKFYVHCRPH